MRDSTAEPPLENTAVEIGFADATILSRSMNGLKGNDHGLSCPRGATQDDARHRLPWTGRLPPGRMARARTGRRRSRDQSAVGRHLRQRSQMLPGRADILGATIRAKATASRPSSRVTSSSARWSRWAKAPVSNMVCSWAISPYLSRSCPAGTAASASAGNIGCARTSMMFTASAKPPSAQWRNTCSSRRARSTTKFPNPARPSRRLHRTARLLNPRGSARRDRTR